MALSRISRRASSAEWRCERARAGDEADDFDVVSDMVSVTLLTRCQNVKQYARKRHSSVTEVEEGGEGLLHTAMTLASGAHFSVRGSAFVHSVRPTAWATQRHILPLVVDTVDSCVNLMGGNQSGSLLPPTRCATQSITRAIRRTLISLSVSGPDSIGRDSTRGRNRIAS